MVARHRLPFPAAQRLLTQAATHSLDAATVDRLATLLTALAAEPSPPTTVTDPTEAADIHVADSLSGLVDPDSSPADFDPLPVDPALPPASTTGTATARTDPGSLLRRATSIADIGAGAGFPGLVLAAVLPNARVDLIESTARKCEVIDRLAATAGIPNATPVPARAEEWAASDGANRYDIVTARALSALPVLVEYAAPLLRDGGHLIAWKGARDTDEEHAGATAADVVGLEPLTPVPVTPFQGSRQRHLYVYAKTTATPTRFPRRPGMATKRPLA